MQQEVEATDEPQPGPSGLQQSPSFAVSPTDIAPVPTYQRPISKIGRGKTAIITDSPYRKELVEKEDSKKPEGRKTRRKLFNTDVKRSKKMENIDSNSDSESEIMDGNESTCQHHMNLQRELTDG